MILQWHIKDPGHSAKSADGRLLVNTYTPLPQQTQSRMTLLSRFSVGTYQGDEITLSSSRNARPVVSAHWAIVDWSWLNEWNQYARAISTKKKKKSAGRNKKSSYKILRCEEKNHAHIFPCFFAGVVEKLEPLRKQCFRKIRATTKALLSSSLLVSPVVLFI